MWQRCGKDVALFFRLYFLCSFCFQPPRSNMEEEPTLHDLDIAALFPTVAMHLIDIKMEREGYYNLLMEKNDVKSQDEPSSQRSSPHTYMLRSTVSNKGARRQTCKLRSGTQPPKQKDVQNALDVHQLKTQIQRFTQTFKCIRFTDKQRAVLTNWFEANRTTPYPTHTDVETLTQATNLTAKQVKIWMMNARRRRSCKRRSGLTASSKKRQKMYTMCFVES